MNMNENSKWKFLSLHNLSTTTTSVSIPENAIELLLFVGLPNTGNSYQVYGGRSYIFPKSQRQWNVIYEKSFYNGSGSTSSGDFYAYWAEDTELSMFAKTGPVRARVYYR